MASGMMKVYRNLHSQWYTKLAKELMHAAHLSVFLSLASQLATFSAISLSQLTTELIMTITLSVYRNNEH